MASPDLAPQHQPPSGIGGSGTTEVASPGEAPDAGAAGSVLDRISAARAFAGKLIFEGTFCVDGRLSGEVFSETGVLAVGPEGLVEANVRVGTLIVRGVVRGAVEATQAVELHATACLEGDVRTPEFSLEKGARFNGSCTMPPAPALTTGEDFGTGGRGAAHAPRQR